nr:hypothetical protein Iba_chr05dCG9930 [Ipomoea batatas]
MPFEADGSKVPISGIRCPIFAVSRPYALRGRWEEGAHLGSKVSDLCADLMALRGRWEKGTHLESKVPNLCGQPTLWPFEADGSKVPISGVKCPIFAVSQPYGPSRPMGARCPSREQGARSMRSADLMALRGRWEQGAHLGSKVLDLCGQPTLWPFEADGSKVPISGEPDQSRAWDLDRLPHRGAETTPLEGRPPRGPRIERSELAPAWLGNPR